MRSRRMLCDAERALLVQRLQRAAAQADLAERLNEEALRRTEVETCEEASEGTLADWRMQLAAHAPDPVQLQLLAAGQAARDAALEAAVERATRAEIASDEGRRALARSEASAVRTAQLTRKLARAVRHALAEKAYAATEDRFNHGKACR